MRRLPSPQPSLSKRLWDKSQTKFLALAQATSGAGLLVLDEVNKTFNNDTVKGYLSELDLPKSITIGLVLIGILTYIAHGHGDDA